MFKEGILKAGNKHLIQKFNFTYRYTDDVLALNNTKTSEFNDLSHMNLKLKIRQSPVHLSHTQIVVSVLTMESLVLGFMTRGTTSISHS